MWNSITEKVFFFAVKLEKGSHSYVIIIIANTCTKQTVEDNNISFLFHLIRKVFVNFLPLFNYFVNLKFMRDTWGWIG